MSYKEKQKAFEMKMKEEWNYRTVKCCGNCNHFYQDEDEPLRYIECHIDEELEVKTDYYYLCNKWEGEQE